jgi:neutral ceramidase
MFCPCRQAIRYGVVVCLLACSALPLQGQESWRVGVAKRKITPRQPMPMAGYASRGATRADGTLNDLWAKAILLESADGQRGLLVTMDLCGIDRELSIEMSRQLESRLELAASQIILSVSHTHSGPVVAKNLRPMHYMLLDDANRRLVDEYADFLVSQVVECGAQALETLAPSRLSYGAGQTTLAVNRRNNPEKEVPGRRLAGELIGPVDYSVPVLAIHQDDQLLATVFGYACHCTTLSGMQWSSDYAGFAQDWLEAEYPGCTAMFWAGCGADQNPLPRRTVDLAQNYGRQLASEVANVLSGVLHPLAPELKTQRQEVALAFDTLPNEAQLRSDTESDNIYVAARAKSLLQQVQSGQPLSPTYPYPIASWRLGGDLDLVVLGGEVVVDYALAIKSKSDDPQSTWIMAYANDVMAYIPSRRVLTEGGYEGGGAMVYYGLPTVWAPEIEHTILSEVDRQLER